MVSALLVVADELPLPGSCRTWAATSCSFSYESCSKLTHGPEVAFSQTASHVAANGPSGDVSTATVIP
jgi:hypothetical protein